MKEKSKLYCYVDETGQDTGGELFLVAVVLKNIGQITKFQETLQNIEQKSGKYKRKWTKTSLSIKEKYLNMLLENKQLERSVFYSAYHNSKEYIPLLALTIAKSIIFQKIDEYSATIVIDGLKTPETEYVRRELKNLNIHYRKIRGMKDGQDAILRLADSMAGFIRDSMENQGYAQEIFIEFTKKKIIMEI